MFYFFYFVVVYLEGRVFFYWFRDFMVRFLRRVIYFVKYRGDRRFVGGILVFCSGGW